MNQYLEMFKNQYPFTLLSEKEFTIITRQAELREFKSREFIIHEESQESLEKK